MRIAVLAYNLRVAGGLAVGRNLVAAMPRVQPDHDYFMVVPKGFGYEPHTGNPRVKYVEVDITGILNRLKFDGFGLRKMVCEYEPDVILGLGNLGIPNPGCRQAILFHKPQLVYPPKHYANDTAKAKCVNRILKSKLKRCLRDTQVVFCQTPVSRSRFAKEFGYPEEWIAIMPNAVSEFVKLDRSQVAPPPVLQNDRHFNMFFLTKYYAHKNLEILLDLYRHYGDALKDTRCIITIAADQHPKAGKFLADIQRYNLSDKIINVGPLKDYELAGYFYGCNALLFPTLLESFSGTYLEAMHFGLPILTSDLDFARYICDDAAEYFNPWDAQDIMHCILRLKHDSSLKEKLIQNGTRKLSGFYKTWDQISRNVIMELEKICQL